jgi:type IV secretion system protein VirD4
MWSDLILNKNPIARNVILAWPLPAIYITFMPLYLFLRPEVGGLMAQYVTCIFPVLILLSCLAYHSILKRSVLPLVCAGLGNLVVGFYHLLSYGQYLSKHLSNLSGLQALYFMFQQNWTLIFLYIFPVILAIGAFRYSFYHNRVSLKSSAKEEDGVKVKAGSHGSARFANYKEVKKLTKQSGFPIGAMVDTKDYSNPKQLVERIKNHPPGDIIRVNSIHSLLIGETGSGKGIGVFIPILLEYQGPCMVIDMKGELYNVTSRGRERMGRKVFAFDPFGTTKAKDAEKVTINVLDAINPKSKAIVDDISDITKILCPVSPGDTGSSEHFKKNAARLIQCVILFVKCSDTFTAKDKNLNKVYDLISQNKEEVGKLLETISDSDIAYGVASRLANQIMGRAREEWSGIFSTAQTALAFIDTPYIKENISTSSFDLQHLVNGVADLFVCIPSERMDSHHPMLRLLTGIIFNKMEKAGGYIGEHNLLMLIDELPALGYMPVINKALSYGRGFGVNIFAVSVTLEMLQEVYPKTWKTFLASDLVIFMGFSDKEVRQYISEELGNVTVDVNSSNKSSGSHRKELQVFGSISQQESESCSEISRPLMAADEIRLLGNDVVIAKVKGQHPIICNRLDYRRRKEWEGMWDENPLHTRRKSVVSGRLSINISPR